MRDALDGGAYVIPLWPTPHRERAARPPRRALAARRAWATSSSPAAAASRPTRRSASPAPTTWPCGRPERWKVVGRHPSYHGLTLGALAVGSHRNRRAGYEPLLLDFPNVPWDDAGRGGGGDRAGGPDTIAGFLFEPITGAAGACLIAADELLAQPSPTSAARHDILLIADEVMTGFGRTGTTWGHEHLPDRARRHLRRQGPRRRLRADRDGRRDGRDRRARCAAAASCSSRSPAATRCAPARPRCSTILEREHLVERVGGDGRDPRRPARTTRSAPTRPSSSIRGRGLFRGIELRPSGGALAQAVVARGAGPRPVGLPGRLRSPGARRRDDRLRVHDHRRPRSSTLVERLTAAIDAGQHRRA